MNHFIFRNQAQAELLSLEPMIQDRIMLKLRSLKAHPKLFEIIKKIHGLEPATHRLRVGNYRLLLKFEQNTSEEKIIRILKVAHRREVYRTKL